MDTSTYKPKNKSKALLYAEEEEKKRSKLSGKANADFDKQKAKAKEERKKRQEQEAHNFVQTNKNKAVSSSPTKPDVNIKDLTFGKHSPENISLTPKVKSDYAPTKANLKKSGKERNIDFGNRRSEFESGVRSVAPISGAGGHRFNLYENPTRLRELQEKKKNDDLNTAVSYARKFLQADDSVSNDDLIKRYNGLTAVDVTRLLQSEEQRNKALKKDFIGNGLGSLLSTSWEEAGKKQQKSQEARKAIPESDARLQQYRIWLNENDLRQKAEEVKTKYSGLQNEPDYWERSSKAEKKLPYFRSEANDIYEYYVSRFSPETNKYDKYKNINLETDNAGKFLTHATPDEMRNYIYLYNKQGEKAAKEYYDMLEPDLRKRSANAEMEKAEKRGKEHPYISTAETIASYVPVSTVGGAAVAKSAITGKVDPYDPLYVAGAAREAEREATTNLIQNDTLRLTYSAVTSAADNAVAALTVGKAVSAFGGAGMSAAAKAAWTGRITGGIMSSGVAANSVLEAKKEGFSDTSALAVGIARGSIEYLSEKFSIERIMKEPTTVLKALKKSVVSEGSEEVVSNWANRLVDNIINMGLTKEYNELVASGMSEKEAFLTVAEKAAYEDLESFMGGAIAGGFMTAGHLGVQTAQVGGVGNMNRVLEYQSELAQMPEEERERIIKQNEERYNKERAVEILTRDNLNMGDIAGALNFLGVSDPQQAAKDIERFKETGKTSDLMKDKNVSSVVEVLATEGYFKNTDKVNDEVKVVKTSARDVTNVKAIEAPEINVKADPMHGVNEDAVKVITDGIGNEGRKAYYNVLERESESAYQGSEATLLRDFNRFYIKGLNGGKLSEVSGKYAKVMTERSMTEAFKAGQSDRGAMLKEKFKAVNNAVIRDGGLIRNVNSENMTNEEISQIDNLGKKFGVSIEIQDHVYNNSNKEVNGVYEAGGIILNQSKMEEFGNVKAAEGFLVKHELTHRVRELAPKGFETLKSVVYDIEDRKSGNTSKAETVMTQRGVDVDTAIEEIVADHMGNEDFALEVAMKDLSLAERIKGWVSDILDRVGIKKYSETQRIKRLWEKACNEAKRTVKNADKRVGNDVKAAGNAKYSIGYTTDNQPVTIINDNLLENVPKDRWVTEAKKAISKFKPAISVSGRFIKVNAMTVNEYTNSKYTDSLKLYEKTKYKDKMNAAGHLDEMILTSTNYVNEDLNHNRKDSIKEFARGKTLLQIGKNQYIADIIIGFTSGKNMVLYDIINLTDTNFKLNQQTVHEAMTKNSVRLRSEPSADNNNISQTNANVNTGTQKNSDSDLSVTIEDIQAVQSVGRKSINDFTSEDIKKTESFARKYFKEMGVKSPFFRAWFGDWRANDTTPVKIANVKGAERGVTKNIDTGWDINVSGKVFNETKSHNQKYNLKARPYLEYINSIVENAVLLDSHTISSDKAKSQNSAIMHSLYAVADIGNGKELLKLYVEELNDVNNDGTIKRAYQLQNIESQQMSDRVQEKSLAPSASTADIYTVSQLFNLVKTSDKNFSPREASKVVNEDGTPKVVYHGTSDDFTVFDITKSRSYDEKLDYDLPGFYFSESIDESGSYGGNLGAYYIDIKNPYEGNTYTLAKKMGSFRKAYDYLSEQGYDGIIDNEMGEGYYEYIVLKAENIKSSTDNIGTFDRGNNDIRYSQGDLSEVVKENKSLRKENEKLKELKDHYKGQMLRTPNLYSPSGINIKKIINRVAIGYTGDKKVLTSQLKQAQELLSKCISVSLKADPKYTNEIYSRYREHLSLIAGDIANNTRTKNDQIYEQYRHIKDSLKGVTIKVDESWKNDLNGVDGYNDFRKKNFGVVKMSLVNGTPVDVLYSELGAKFGELFPEDITTEPEQLIHITETVRAMSNFYENPYNSDMDSVIEGIADTLDLELLTLSSERTQADKYFDEAQKQIETAIEERDKAVRKIQDKYNRKIEEFKEEQRQKRENSAKRKEEATTRQKLLTLARRMKRIANNGRTTPANQALIQELIGHVDTIAVSMTGATVKNLQNLSKWYKNAAERINFVPNPRIEEDLARLDNQKIDEMNFERVMTLITALENIEKQIENENIEIGKKGDVYEKGMATIEHINNSGGSAAYGLNNAKDAIVTGLSNPVNEIHRLTGYADDDALYQTTKDIRKSELVEVYHEMKANKLFEEYTKDKKFMKHLREDFKTFTVKQYDALGNETGEKEIRLNPAMIISLAQLAKNSGSLLHMTEGGVRIADEKIYKHGKIKEAYDRGTVVKMVSPEIRKITSTLNETDRAYMRKVEKYFNEFAKNEINAVSQQLDGIDRARVGFYYPMNTDSSFLVKEFDTISYDASVENQGSLKERVRNAKNPLLLMAAPDVVSRAISNNGKYIAYAIPLRNFKKLWNTMTRGDLVQVPETDKYKNVKLDENGDVIMKNVYKNNFEGSVKDSVERVWGHRAVEYVENFIKDIETGRSDKTGGATKVLNFLHGNYVKAVLTLNLPVAINQVASFPSAAPVLGWKPLLMSLKDLGKVDLELISQYTGAQWNRTKGAYDPTIADAYTDNKALPKILDWMMASDSIITRKLWKASEYYVRIHKPRLEIGTHEYYRAVADIYETTMQETQPNSGVMERPAVLRADSATRLLMPFTGEPLKNVNLLYDAFGNMAAKKKQLDRVAGTQLQAEAEKRLKEAKKNLKTTIVSQVLASAAYTVFVALARIAFGGKNGRKKYEDEEGNLTAASILKAMGKDFLITSLTQIPFTSDLVDFIAAIIKGEKYYAPELISLQALTDATEACINTASLISDFIKGDGGTWQQTIEKINNSAIKVSTLVGIPLKNIENIANSLMYWGSKTVFYNNPTMQKYAVAKFSGTLVEKKKNKKTGEIEYTATAEAKKILYNAFVNGETDNYENILFDLVDSGVKASDLESAMRNLSQKDDNFAFDKSLGAFAGVKDGEDYEKYENYMKRAEKAEVSEEDLKKGIDIIDSGKPYKEMYTEITSFTKNMGEKQKTFFDDIARGKYSANELNKEQYKSYSKTRKEITETLEKQFDKTGLKNKEINDVQNKIYQYAEKTALENASNGEYRIDSEWIKQAGKSESTIGVNTAEFIKLYNKYGEKVYSEQSVITHEVGYNVNVSLEYSRLKSVKGTESERDEKGEIIKGKSKQDKIIAIIDGMDITDSEKAYLFSIDYKANNNNPWAGSQKVNYKKYLEQRKD